MSYYLYFITKVEITERVGLFEMFYGQTNGSKSNVLFI